MINRFIRIIISFCFTTLFTAVTTQAQNIGKQKIDIKIFFPYDKAHIDSSYMENEHSLYLVDSLLRDTLFISTLQKIEITAQSSPEGSIGYNTLLSERRRQSLKEHFTTYYPQIDTSLWSFNAVAENWELFHKNLSEDTNLPNRKEVLSISSSERDADAKEWLLKTMNEGKPWRYIKENILPSQRFGASVLFIPTIIHSISTPLKFNNKLTLPQLELPRTIQPTTKESKILFALKTNLVLDALSVVNLAVEIPIDERWSVVGEVVYPWWRSWPTDFTMQIESYHAEVKYWLGDRTSKEQLQGWSIGAYGGWGRYDIQPFSRKGVQGSFNDYGLEVGYAHKIARNLNLEYTLGIGYISSKYENYKMAYNTNEFGDIKVIPYPWMKNSLKTVLPTRCGVSLVWTIKNKERK